MIPALTVPLVTWNEITTYLLERSAAGVCIFTIIDRLSSNKYELDMNHMMEHHIQGRVSYSEDLDTHLLPCVRLRTQYHQC